MQHIIPRLGNRPLAVALCSRLLANLHLPLFQIHDPAFRNTGGGVERQFELPVEAKRGVGGFDYQMDICRAGVALGVIAVPVTEQGEVGFRL